MDTYQTAAFPSLVDRQALHQLLRTAGWNLERAFIDEQQRWFWHAYDYGWRRVVMGDNRKFSPIDPDKGDGAGKWYDASLAAVAEKFYRTKLNKPAPKAYPQPSHPGAIRADWRKIPSPYLTDAERAIAMPEIARMRQEIAENLARVGRMPRERGDQSGDWHKAPPPPPLADPDDPGVQEWMRKMGEL